MNTLSRYIALDDLAIVELVDQGPVRDRYVAEQAYIILGIKVKLVDESLFGIAPYLLPGLSGRSVVNGQLVVMRKPDAWGHFTEILCLTGLDWYCVTPTWDVPLCLDRQIVPLRC